VNSWDQAPIKAFELDFTQTCKLLQQGVIELFEITLLLDIDLDFEIQA
jgi:hypothetical protein